MQFLVNASRTTFSSSLSCVTTSIVNAQCPVRPALTHGGPPGRSDPETAAQVIIRAARGSIPYAWIICSALDQRTKIRSPVRLRSGDCLTQPQAASPGIISCPAKPSPPAHTEASPRRRFAMSSASVVGTAACRCGREPCRRARAGGQASGLPAPLNSGAVRPGI